MNAVKWAFRVAVIFALLCLLATLANPVAGLLIAAAYAAFAWGIRKRQRWAAIAWLAFLLLPIPFALRLGGVSTAQIVFAAALQLAITVLVLGAALELWRSQASSRVAWPWVTAIVVMLVFLICLHPYVLPTASMEPTLLPGDYFLTESVTPGIWGAPQRDELVTFRNPADPKQVWVKRVAGIPGDRLRIVNKQLLRNGRAVDEPYAAHRSSYIDSFRDNFPSEPSTRLPQQAEEMLANDVRNGEVIVPAGQYFVLGDNRDDSLDSRYLGFVPAGNIIGRPWLIYASYAERDQHRQRTAFNTRWNRLFKVL